MAREVFLMIFPFSCLFIFFLTLSLGMVGSDIQLEDPWFDKLQKQCWGCQTLVPQELTFSWPGLTTCIVCFIQKFRDSYHTFICHSMYSGWTSNFRTGQKEVLSVFRQQWVFLFALACAAFQTCPASWSFVLHSACQVCKHVCRWACPSCRYLNTNHLFTLYLVDFVSHITEVHRFRAISVV